MKLFFFCIMLIVLPTNGLATSDPELPQENNSRFDPNWLQSNSTISRSMILSGAFTSPFLVIKAYENNSYRPLWVNRINDSSWLWNLRDSLVSLRYDALPVWRYSVRQIIQLSTEMNKPDLLDIFITDALITAIADLKGQHFNYPSLSSTSTESMAGKNVLSLIWELQKGLKTSVVLQSLLPRNPMYISLRNSYKDIYGTRVRIIMPNKRHLRVGSRGYDVRLLIKRLEAEGFLNPMTTQYGSAFFDSILETAVKTYQQHHGLKQDGIVGPLTRASLNRGTHDVATIMSSKIQQLREQYAKVQML